MSLVPPINVAGIYSLSGPWSQDVVPNTPYTCVAVRKFVDIIRKGEDPFTLYYAPKSLNVADYQRDSQYGECIVTLRSAGGQFIYVPTSYIQSYPNQSGIPYAVMVLGVNLGAVPNHADLSVIRQKISDVVQGYYGITPSIQQAVISEVVTKTAADHGAIEAARQSAIIERQTDYSKLLLAEQTILSQAQKIAQLEAYIKARLPI